MDLITIRHLERYALAVSAKIARFRAVNQLSPTIPRCPICRTEADACFDCILLHTLRLQALIPE